MSPSTQPRRGASVGAPLKTALALAGLALLALPACENPTVTAPDEPVAAAPGADVGAAPALVAVPGGECEDPVAYATGDPDHPRALYQVCWPVPLDAWNGLFIIYAHGYTNPGTRLAISPEAADLAPFALSQGFAFASTSYRVNGLAIKEGVEDMATLAGLVRTEAKNKFLAEGVPVLITGASEGGAVATLAAERYPRLFQGALSTCGPTGNFQKQLDYFGDFNVLFNYFFPGVFADPGHPGRFKVSPEGVDLDVIRNAERYSARAAAAVAADPAAAAKLIKVSGAAVDDGDPASVWETISGILRYNVLATNDALAKLGGQPFDNTRRWYWGSGNDFRLNRLVQRVHANAAARAEVATYYETSGHLAIPYVSLHTTGDPIVQFIQQPWYRLKALLAGSAAEHSAFPVFRYGHCAFEEGDLTLGLALLMLKVGAASAPSLAAAMPTVAARSDFQRLAKEIPLKR